MTIKSNQKILKANKKKCKFEKTLEEIIRPKEKEKIKTWHFNVATKPLNDGVLCPNDSCIQKKNRSNHFMKLMFKLASFVSCRSHVIEIYIFFFKILVKALIGN